MKKSPAILILFWATVGLANPIAAQLFSNCILILPAGRLKLWVTGMAKITNVS